MLHMKMLPGFLLLVVVIGIASFIKMVIDRRKFYRRNHAGIEEFPSYTASVITRFLEGSLYKVANFSQISAGVLFVLMLLKFSHHGK